MPSTLCAAILALQAAAGAPPAHRTAAPSPGARRAAAARALRPPVIDGRDDDPVWAGAAPITEFREFQPVEDGEPRFPTVAKVAYDERNLYVFIRAFDPHPDSILAILARRDVRAPTDQLKIIIDSYHDRRSGYEFAVNPAGVKRDYAIYNDNQEDDAWDAVWDVATRIDSLGWTAEFRIPLSQLRYVPRGRNTFGFGIWRDVQRYTERYSWPLFRNSQAGIASQLGELTDLVGLPSPRRLEAAPYAVAKNVSVPRGMTFGRSQRVTAGADLKYGLTPNLTLDATVNPDFGQVEADPAVLNLTAFETFFPERRPFFVAGTGIFRFDVDCNQVNCNNEGLFYSRRIGRAPQLGRAYGDGAAAAATTIAGAAKLTGRLPGGQTLGLLDAVTLRAVGSDGRTTEPATNYAALRVQQDLRAGQTGVGAMVTAVDRWLDPWTRDSLRRTARVGAVDARHRFAGARYEVAGAVAVSRVSGSPAAIAATERDPVHYYQRPDAGLPYDSTRSALGGDAEEVFLRKVGGGATHFETSYQRRSPGFEINDLGFLLRADQQSWSTWVGVQSPHPAAFYQQAFWNVNWWQSWTAAGLPLERAANSNAHAQLANRWWVHAGATFGQLGAPFCDRCARGGPAVRVDPYVSLWSEVDGDDRYRVVPAAFVNYVRADGGRSENVSLNAQLVLRVASRFSATVGIAAAHNVSDAQWYQNFRDAAGTTHYTFAHLDQTTASLTGRVDYTATRDLTVQVYAQPFVSKGAYGNIRELADPRAAAYDARYRPYGDTAVTSAPGGFNVKQFRSNVVVRWEYRPGSTLFLVWTQGREGSAAARGSRSLAGDFGDLFGLHPDNTFLVKASYWVNW
jgi:hypothetical protein